MTETLDPVQSALSEIRAFGLLVDRLEFGAPPGKKAWRVDVEGQKRGKRAGWYICHEVLLGNGQRVVVGGYGIWEGDRNNAQKLKVLGGAKLDDEARAKIKLRQKQAAADAEAAEEELKAATTAKANDIWKKLPSRGDSPYLTRKGVSAYGLGGGRDGVIVVPARNTAGVITQLQFIYPDGDKKWLNGPGKQGAFHLIGTVVEEHPLVFAEGYATAASIHMATGWPVLVCFDAGNMLEVAQRLKSIYDNVRFVFAADDDHEKKRNAGREVVTEGAKRFRGLVVFPRFKDPAGRTDFNDVHVEQGLEAVREQLQVHLTPKLPSGDKATWAAELVFGRDGALAPMVNNLLVVFQNDPRWAGVFAYNEFAKRIVKRREPPYGGGAGWMRDTDEIETAAWFGRANTYAANIPTTIARQACIAMAERNPFHPIRDYLSSLKWDKTDRLPTFFTDFCGVTKQTDVTSAFARNFFIAAVARIFQPGCKSDLMLVLEGEQGARKSTLASVLAGIGGYADVGTAPSDKDFFQIIQGVWIAEISEMASFAKAENSHIKRAISVAVDRFRKSYGHNVEEFARECVFFGSVNNSDWQRDETGGRRYMPVWVADIDIDGVKAVRDQLWAEAVFRYQSGEAWHILPEGAKLEQEKRYLEDVWMEPVSRWLDTAPLSGKLREKVTVSDVLRFALDMEAKKQDRSAQTRVGNILARLKWVKRQRKSDGVRVYHRPEQSALRPAEEEAA